MKIMIINKKDKSMKRKRGIDTKQKRGEFRRFMAH